MDELTKARTLLFQVLNSIYDGAAMLIKGTIIPALRELSHKDSSG